MRGFGSIIVALLLLLQEAGLAAWAVSLVLVVTWQVAAWHEDGLSPNCLGNIVTLSRASLARVPAMLAGSLISYRSQITTNKVLIRPTARFMRQRSGVNQSLLVRT